MPSFQAKLLFMHFPKKPAYVEAILMHSAMAFMVLLLS